MENRYEEALERARQGKPIEEVFPELKESEDERIRKSVIGFLKTIASLKDGKTVSNEDFDSEALLEWASYLEKQKEQKPYQEVLSDSENRMLDYHASLVRGEERKPFAHENDFVSKSKGYIENAAHNYAMNFGDKESELYIEIFDAYKAGAYYAELRQKPAEWSEEDKYILEDAITAIDMHLTDEFKEIHPNLFKAFLAAKDFLKSLPERFNLQPKQEWSEEDEKVFNGVIDTIKDAIAECDCDDVGTKARIIYEKELKWLETRLKSLRPQPHWKPSEYTLSLVKKVANGEMLTHMEQMAMETLCNDLQKLL